MSRGLTDPFVEDEDDIPASNGDIMSVVLTLFVLVESLHQRLDAAGFPTLERSQEVRDGE